MTSHSMRSAATLGSASHSSCLAVSLPGLSCPDPALADTLAPDPLSLSDGHHPSPGAAPAVAPHPDVHSIEPVAVALYDITETNHDIIHETILFFMISCVISQKQL
jgi:hypothetical protein